MRAGAAGDKVLPLNPTGDAEAAIKSATKVVKAEYIMPLLSHSPMEPMNFTASVHDGKVDLIGPPQWQDGAQGTVAKALRGNVPPAAIRRDLERLAKWQGARDLDVRQAPDAWAALR